MKRVVSKKDLIRSGWVQEFAAGEGIEKTAAKGLDKRGYGCILPLERGFNFSLYICEE